MRTKFFWLGIALSTSLGATLGSLIPSFLERYVREPIRVTGTLKVSSTSVEPPSGFYIDGRIYIMSKRGFSAKDIGMPIDVSGHFGSILAENGAPYPALFVD